MKARLLIMIIVLTIMLMMINNYNNTQIRELKESHIRIEQLCDSIQNNLDSIEIKIDRMDSLLKEGIK